MAARDGATLTLLRCYRCQLGFYGMRPPHFKAPKTIQVGDQQLTADRFVIAAGSRATVTRVIGACVRRSTVLPPG